MAITLTTIARINLIIPSPTSTDHLLDHQAPIELPEARMNPNFQSTALLKAKRKSAPELYIKTSNTLVAFVLTRGNLFT